MKIAFVIIALIIFFIALLLFVPVYVVFEAWAHDKKNDFTVKIKYLFLNIKMNPKKNPGKSGKKPKTKKSIKDVKEKENTKEKGSKTTLEKIEKGIEVYKYIEDDVAEIIAYAADHAVTVKQLKLIMRFGLDDAMYTGIATGALYGVIYNVIALLDRHLTVHNHEVNLTPEFEGKCFALDGKCILKVKNVHIMIIVFKVLKMYFKITKMK